jgi:hypothetical protein
MAYERQPACRDLRRPPGALQADLFLLMTRYGHDPDPTLAHEIVRRLEAMARHPLFDLLSLGEQRAVARVARIWRGRCGSPANGAISRRANRARPS